MNTPDVSHHMNLLPVEDFCTLPTAAQPRRLMEFDELFRRQIRPPCRIDRNRIEFTFASSDGLYAQVSDLAARESACCSFFEFTIDAHDQDATHQGQLLLRVGVPASHGDVLEALTHRAVAAIARPDDEQ
jgi:hypothetical protein